MVDGVVLGAQHEKRQSWTPTAAALGPAALHDGHDIRQEAISVLPGDAEHLHITSLPDLLHQGQRFPSGDWDSAKDDDAGRGQRLADRLDERLAEQLHFPNLINDAHSVSEATAGDSIP